MNLKNLTLSEIVRGLDKKEFSSVDITRWFLERINKYDAQLNCFVTVNEKALDEARERDKERENGRSGPLLGVPVAIKDNFLTQGLRTTASSKLLDNYIPQYDATVVSRLKDAGIVILGKTNMDAWAHGSSTETSDFGPTKNPWDTTRLPGGSSGGSAAAVASGLAPVAIGSETAGSVRQPAAWCGVTGFKPTYGRVSRYGVIAMASSTDSPGPLAQSVADSVLVTQVIAGADPFDATTSPRQVEDYTKSLADFSVSGLKIGLAVDYLLPDMDPKVKEIIRTAAGVFKKLGAQVGEVRLLDPRYSIGVYTIVQRAEVSSNLARFDGIRFGHPRDFFAEEAKRRIMLGTYTLSAGYHDQYYNKAQKVRTLIIDDFQKAFSRFDLVLGPVSPGPALKIGASQGDPMFGEMQDVLVEPSSIAGLPSFSVPCGFVDNLPIGLQITGPQFSEKLVFQAAHAYQQSTSWHSMKPELTNTN